MTSDTKYPSSRSAGDIAYAAVKSTLAFIPPASELLQFVLQSPLEKRRDEWLRSVGERLQELEQKKSIDLRQLQQNEQFISAVLQATQAALRTHQSEKLMALRHAVENLAQGFSLDDTVLFMLLSHVDTLSEMHLRILHVVDEFKLPAEMPSGRYCLSFVEVIEYNIPELRDRTLMSLTTIERVLTDLSARGLINMEWSNISIENELPHTYTTLLGQSLLQFIARV